MCFKSSEDYSVAVEKMLQEQAARAAASKRKAAEAEEGEEKEWVVWQPVVAKRRRESGSAKSSSVARGQLDEHTGSRQKAASPERKIVNRETREEEERENDLYSLTRH